MRFLVTAGNTRQRIDQVRDWGNIFTGNTGFSIARALAEHGPVDLLTSNPQHIEQAGAGLGSPHPVTAVRFGDHAQLRAMLAEAVAAHTYQAILMTAAVSDYDPAGVFEVVNRERAEDGSERWVVRDVQRGKVSSGHRAIAVLGQPTEKIVDLFRKAWGYRGRLFKFKLEVGVGEAQLLEIAEASRRASGADYLIANTLEMVRGDRPGAFLLGEHEPPRWVDRQQLPALLAQLAAG